ncbi:SigE family RNA polymerase sigma factor [Nocardioides acrostichi]|uniref:SigE family RNA polymerase sigma factor n=1 Tax=Nocardioides acrostichi TaxID=2784339 RepID=UPI002E2AF22A|nr:SigE family RNA polymerase sigma factor [Nocardioides acrostichi]
MTSYGLLLAPRAVPGVRVVTESAREQWGADEALDALYLAHWRGLVRLSTLLLNDSGAAEEVVQDAFVAMHARWSRLRDPDKALAYLRQSVVNKSRSVLRHRGVVERHVATRRVEPAPTTPDAATLEGDRRDAVLAAMARLPERQRAVLALRHYLELSEAEIADTLRISRGAVKSHASRGSARLRELLAPYLEAER